MKAELTTRIIMKDRIPLQTILPLEAPLVLFIDPSDACCLKCNFCPTGDRELMRSVGRPLTTMKLPLYKKIIDDLQEFETKIKVIRLYSHGEPLLNHNFCEMVKYAKASNKVETVDTTTNALLLNEKLNLDIIASGIDRINISVNGINAEQYKSFTNVEIDFESFVANIKHLYDNRKQCYIFIKINGDTISKEDEQKFLDIFGDTADGIAIEKSMNCWNNFEMKGDLKPNNEVGIYGQELSHVDICPYVFYSFAIGSTGKVSMCFLDWNMTNLVGDIKAESVKSIWNDYSMQEIRKMMLRGERKNHPTCRSCDQLVRGMPTNLDAVREDLLKKYI